MAQLDHILLADGATARPDGKIDIFGAAWDTIFANAVPAVHPQIAIALRVLVSQQEAESPHQIDLRLMGPDGPALARAQANMPPAPAEALAAWPPGQRQGFGAIVNFQNTVFPQFGAYHIAILWDGTELRDPLVLNVAPIPTAPANADDSH